MPQLIVYLVHGTWPFGPFGKERPDKSLSWFDSSSDFTAEVTAGLEKQVHLRDFRWRGNNSFSARSARRDQAHDLQSEGTVRVSTLNRAKNGRVPSGPALRNKQLFASRSR